MALPQKKAASAAPVNFGDLGMYSGGVFIPNGDYILFHNVLMHQATDKAGAPKGPARLGVMIDFFPKETPTEDHKLQQFYSLGSKADQSFAPNPETGKGIVPIPGAVGTGLNDKTNWALLLKSYYDSGLPEGVFTNDLSMLDGVHVHIENVDEPTDRAGFQSATAEVAQEQRKPGKIAVVTQILEGGAPWEGGGGLETVTVTPAKTTAKPPVKSAPVAKGPVAPVVKQAEDAGDEEAVKEAATEAIFKIIEKSPNGKPRLALRTETFAAVKKAVDEETAGKVISTFFEAGCEAALNNILGEMGYSIQGPQVKPIPA